MQSLRLLSRPALISAVPRALIAAPMAVRSLTMLARSCTLNSLIGSRLTATSVPRLGVRGYRATPVQRAAQENPQKKVSRKDDDRFVPTDAEVGDGELCCAVRPSRVGECPARIEPFAYERHGLPSFTRVFSSSNGWGNCFPLALKRRTRARVYVCTRTDYCPRLPLRASPHRYPSCARAHI